MLPEPASDRPLGSGQIAALLPVALLAALGIFHLGTKSLWLDEAFSAQMAILDPHQFRAVVQTLDPNMALYYLLLRGWHRLGTSDAWLRALSVVTAAAAVLPLVAVGRRLVGNAAAVYGALLFATNPFVVHHAQEARSYGLLLLLTAAATLALVRLVERASPLRWTAYVLLAVLALYTHLFAAWVLAAHAVACAWPDRARRPRRSLPAAFAAIAVLAMPLGLWLRATPRHPDWIPPLTLRRLGSSALELAGGGALLAALLGVLGVLGTVICWRAATDGDRWKVRLLLAWLWAPILGTIGLSVAVAPAFVTRFMLPAVPALVLLAGAGIASLRPPGARALVLAVALILAARGLLRWYARPGEDWRGAAHFILARGQPTDAVVVEPAWAWPGMAHYLRGAGPAAPQSRFPSAAWRAPDPLSDELGQTYREWLGHGLPGDDRLWLVERLRGKPSSELDAEWLPTAVAERYCVRATQVTRRVLVRLVERCH